MLEIILIIFLAKRIGKIAQKKGRDEVGYQVLFIVLWIVFEIGFACFALINDADILMCVIFGLIGAGMSCAVSFLFVDSLSEKKIQIHFENEEKKLDDIVSKEEDKIVSNIISGNESGAKGDLNDPEVLNNLMNFLKKE